MKKNELLTKEQSLNVALKLIKDTALFYKWDITVLKTKGGDIEITQGGCIHGADYFMALATVLRLSAYISVTPTGLPSIRIF